MYKHFHLSVCSAMLAFTSLSAFGGSLFNIQTVIAAPTMVVAGQTGVITYKISTQLSGPNGVIYLPAGVTQYVDGEANDCSAPTFTLTPSTFCLLHLKIDASHLSAGQNINGNPLIDNHPELPPSLYTPIPNGINIQIVSPTHAGLPALQINSATTIFNPGTTTNVIINNLSNVDANYVGLTLPSDIESHIQNINRCAVIKANGSCTISVSLDATSPATALETATVQGANTPPASFNVQTIIPPNVTVSLTPDTTSHLQYEAIIVKNISANSITLNNVTEVSSDTSKLINCQIGNPTCTNACTVGTTLAPNASCNVWIHSKDQSQNSTLNLGTYPETYMVLITPSVGDVIGKTFQLNYKLGLYIGGFFTKNAALTTTFNHVAVWDGSTLSSLGTGLGNAGDTMSNAVYALTLFQGDLYAGGNFDQSLNNIARWNPATHSWEGLMPNGSNMNAGLNGAVNALVSMNNKLYVGGAFTSDMNNLSLNYIAAWNGTSWQSLTQNGHAGLNQEVNALLTNTNDLYVGGEFTATANNALSLGHIAKWNTLNSTWEALQQTGQASAGVYGNSVKALTQIGSAIYLGGSFPYYGCSTTSSCQSANQRANNIISWDINSNTWHPILAGGTAPGLSDSVYALDAINNNMYAGGLFASNADGNVALNLIGLLKNNGWNALIQNNNAGLAVSSVNAILAQGNDVYVGGHFTSTGGGLTTLNYIARWDGNSWHPISSGNNQVGLNSAVESFAVVSSLSLN